MGGSAAADDALYVFVSGHHYAAGHQLLFENTTGFNRQRVEFVAQVAAAADMVHDVVRAGEQCPLAVDFVPAKRVLEPFGFKLGKEDFHNPYPRQAGAVCVAQVVVHLDNQVV